MLTIQKIRNEKPEGINKLRQGLLGWSCSFLAEVSLSTAYFTWVGTALLCSEAPATKEIVMDIFYPRTPRKEQPLFVRHCEESGQHQGHSQCVPALRVQHTSSINIVYRGRPFSAPTATVLLQGHTENARTHHHTLHDGLWSCIVLALR